MNFKMTSMLATEELMLETFWTERDFHLSSTWSLLKEKEKDSNQKNLWT